MPHGMSTTSYASFLMYDEPLLSILELNPTAITTPLPLNLYFDCTAGAQGQAYMPGTMVEAIDGAMILTQVSVTDV